MIIISESFVNNCLEFSKSIIHFQTECNAENVLVVWQTMIYTEEITYWIAWSFLILLSSASHFYFQQCLFIFYSSIMHDRAVQRPFEWMVLKVKKRHMEQDCKTPFTPTSFTAGKCSSFSFCFNLFSLRGIFALKNEIR